MKGTAASLRRIPRRLLKHLLSLILFYSGAWAVFRKIRIAFKGGRITILAYHGVNEGPFSLNLFLDPMTFSAQMRFLRNSYKVIALADAVTLLQGDVCLDQDYIALTFDDGYKDNYIFAFPVLSRLGLPATIFLTTDPINSGFPTFIYALILAMNAGKGSFLDLSQHSLGRYRLDGRASQESTIAEIDQRAKYLSADERRALLDHILAQFSLTRANALFRDKMLTWDEIRQMRQCGIAFGAHTVTHPVLGELAPAELRREVSESKRVIEQQLGEVVTFFAYPYGGRNDVTLTAADIVRESGFSSAVVLYEDLGKPTNLYTLGRKMVSDEMTSGVGGRFSPAVFACELSGLFDVLPCRSRL